MPKIPLYNQGAGPTVGVAAGQLSPRASAAAFTAPGKAAMGYQKVFSDIGSVAAEFEMAQQKVEADTLETDLTSQLNEQLTELENEQIDDINVYQQRADEIFTGISDRVNQSERINSRLKSGISNKLASRFSNLSIGGKQNAFGRKLEKQANSAMRGLNTLADQAKKDPSLIGAIESDARLIWQSLEESGSDRLLSQTKEEYFSNLQSGVLSVGVESIYQSLKDGSINLSQAQQDFDVFRNQVEASTMSFEQQKEILNAIDAAESDSKVSFYNDSISSIGVEFDNINVFVVDKMIDGLARGETTFTYQDQFGNERQFNFDGLDVPQLQKMSEAVQSLKTNKRTQERDSIIGSLQDMSSDGASASDFEQAAIAIRDGREYTYTKEDGTEIVIDSLYLSQGQQGELRTVALGAIENVDNIVLEKYGVGAISAATSGTLESYMLTAPEGVTTEQRDEQVAISLQRKTGSLLRDLSVANEEDAPAILEQLNQIEGYLKEELNGEIAFELKSGDAGRIASNTLNSITAIKAEQRELLEKRARGKTIASNLMEGKGLSMISIGFATPQEVQAEATQIFANILSDDSLSMDEKLKSIANLALYNDVEYFGWKETFQRGYNFGRDAAFAPGSDEFAQVQNALNTYNTLSGYTGIVAKHTTPQQRAFFDELNSRLPFESFEAALMNTRDAIRAKDAGMNFTIPKQKLERAAKKLVDEANPAFFRNKPPINDIATTNLLREVAENRLEIGLGDTESALEWAMNEILNTHVWIDGSYQMKDDFNEQSWFEPSLDLFKESLIKDAKAEVPNKIILDPTREYKENDLRIVKSEFSGNYIVTDIYGQPLDGVVYDEQGNDTGLTRIVTVTSEQLKQIGAAELVRLEEAEKARIQKENELNKLRDKAYGPSASYEEQTEYLREAGKSIDILSLKRTEDGVELFKSGDTQIVFPVPEPAQEPSEYGFMERTRREMQGGE